MIDLHNLLLEDKELACNYPVDDPPNGFWGSIYALEKAETSAKAFELAGHGKVDSIYGFEWYSAKEDQHMCMWGFHSEGICVTPVVGPILVELSVDHG